MTNPTPTPRDPSATPAATTNAAAASNAACATRSQRAKRAMRAVLAMRAVPAMRAVLAMRAMRVMTVTAAAVVVAGAAALFATTPSEDAGVVARAPLASRVSIVLAPHDGDGVAHRLVAERQRELRAAPESALLLERLGWAFVAKAREDDDPGLYALAEMCAQLARRRGATDEADLLEGHTLHAVHRFAEAEVVARRLVRARGLGVDHALLGDVLLDRGDLERAARHYQRLMNRNPGAAAYVRTAELRRRIGDVDGAIEAAHVALRAIGHADHVEYARIAARLADHLLEAGKPDAALRVAAAATLAAPRSRAAIVMHGRALLAVGRAAEAVDVLERAAAHEAPPELLWPLADAHDQLGDHERAAAYRARIEREGARFDARATAHYLASAASAVPGRGSARAARALVLAHAELAARSDAYTLDTVAWARRAAGDLRGARDSIERALSRGNSDARLRYHAGVIAHESGAVDEARRWLTQAYERRQALLPSERERLNARLCRLDPVRCRPTASAPRTKTDRRGTPS